MPKESPSQLERSRREWEGRESRTLPSGLTHPPLRATAASLIRHFEELGAEEPAPLRNPHHEAKVTPDERSTATPSAVLIPIVDHSEGPTVLVTRRHESISYGGHICFPGGRADDADESPLATALRETREEIGLPADRVRVLGRLGDYVTHSGFRISPFVGLVKPPLRLTPSAGEVEAIMEIPLARVLCADSYELRSWGDSDRAHFVLHHGEIWVTGPTVSLMIGLYESLIDSHS